MVNGKLRARVAIPLGADEAAVTELVFSVPRIQLLAEGGLKKHLYVKNKVPQHYPEMIRKLVIIILGVALAACGYEISDATTACRSISAPSPCPLSPTRHCAAAWNRR